MALRLPWGQALLLVALTGSGCGGDGSDAATGIDAADGTDAIPGFDSGPGNDGGPGTDGGGSTDAGTAACPAGELGASLGRDRLLIGGAMEDADFAGAPFDVRYLYLAGNVPDPGPCGDCASGCVVEGVSCDNGGPGCNWWGCWQWDQVPPGQYVIDHVTETEMGGAVPMFTYYIWFSVAGYVEGAPEVAALTDGAAVARYLADWRFLHQVIAGATSGPVIVHMEPDLSGYGHQVDADPTNVPVSLAAAGVPECTGLGDDFEGFFRCMVAIARAEAPNVLLGVHASAWGAGADALINTDPAFDMAGHAADTTTFLTAMGGRDADLVVVEMSDRDAGFNDRWWDATDATLPSFVQAIDWVAAVGNGLGLAPLWWQVPYGNLALEDMCDRYSDNRVDYVFDHPERFAEGGALGVAFGAGAGCMTTPATDDGHFVSRAATYFAGSRPPLCGN